MSEPNGTHLGDGAYIVPDAFGHHQLWLAANDHRNRAVALNPMAFENMARWISSNAPSEYRDALIRGLGVTP